MKTRQHTLVVDLLFDESCGQRQAQDHLHNWLETFCHTSSSHGFQFVSVGVHTGKRLSKAPSLSNEREDASN